MRVASRCWLGQLDILGFLMFIFDANDEHRYHGKYHVQLFNIKINCVSITQMKVGWRGQLRVGWGVQQFGISRRPGTYKLGLLVIIMR